MEVLSEQQLFFMRKAVALGERGRLLAPPNPWVGCVIVKNGCVIGEGWHKGIGFPHAEVCAIQDSPCSLEGAEVYVTLEPCCHFGRTPPCVDLLIKSKVAAVYVALLDPDPRVCKKGIARLREAGIPVYVGIGSKEAKASLQPYLHQRETGLPWVVMKTAASLDGQTADREGRSQWISGELARADVGKLRAESQAVIVGSRTVCLDNPRLSARQAHGNLYERQPLRVVIDSLGKVPLDARVWNADSGKSLLATTEQCSLEYKQRLEDLGVEVWQSSSQQVDLRELLQTLAAKGCLQVLIEGGAQLHSAFWKEDLVNAGVIYLGPKFLGDQGSPMLQDLQVGLANAKSVKITEISLVGDSVKVCFERECR
ncbi:bifunctional diaminohydroxyphosphoribosylaminopyrimidine deaminase/5-amino-6-(5-phosphoribosylamino)uracil reductase RibD [Chlamydia suis]|uniref:bifunctional diaminohydroxyphosphoribosylaminopyrimidine deaminase/5-amino-6-(5-phosphoribosylamino)uracil reductase RibD n=1 Tax=Chlamydia suis TaxID=83559 RepID=UPI0009B0C071|nr:bifunctional diaminohydroxyphosphoribosylaminopyrimidine deaminase/5-amino-6-(5-phosphoribosylamino)uracil reductase RibD [Chlamydia suis]QYC81177.1 bifunctional diaminohydroxyphosphoribosylaminopyrimidine deaminase/5-amino-6-(5-phosphoribosylamino)uracil reductase RibD [Chlamydia suis]QYC82088.1 bifunctional diaminohydroxyphosphoribosylaminopyrimidine deaminase/5-amino-6-(5-phosphoribosylamino)uracil reductase RibD [Chlamydia suis]QYC82995.1 bifunctional diaminohydroxyphosphoribosylaminopyri